MKVLFIGGTGNISSACTELALAQKIELWHLNRGRTSAATEGVKVINADITDTVNAKKALAAHEWDCVVNWIAFIPADIERDLQLFSHCTRQYIFISSASCYQTPPQHPVITETTPLSNPLWSYSQDKIACEQRLQRALEDGFPITVVRPSHTYSTVIPIAIGGWTEFTAVDRMQKGLPVVVHGDGTSLWVLTHARDFALGFTGLIGNTTAIGETFHITSDEVLTWNQIYQQLAAAIGTQAQLVHVTSDKICRFDQHLTGDLLGDKSSSVIFDNAKIKRYVPSFKASIPFAEGIKSTLAWFEAEPSRKMINPASNQLIDRLIASELRDY